MEPDLVAVREGTKSIPRARESPQSFALSIPAPALLTQVDEHSLELYVVTPDGIAVTQRVHAAFLICVKTAAIMGAVLCSAFARSLAADVSIEGTRAGEKRRILRAVPLRQPVCERPLPQENPCTDSSRPRAFD